MPNIKPLLKPAHKGGVKMEAIKFSAQRKMSIVDELSPKMRAIVHEIGLSDFSRKHSRAYKIAKKKAGLMGKSMRGTQRTSTTKFIHKIAA